LVIISSVADDDALFDYVERERWLIAAALLVSLILLGAGVLLWRRTERQEKVEQDLRQSKELLIESQRLGAIGYMFTDTGAGRVYLSDTMFEILGLPPADFLAMPEAFRLVHPDDRDAYAAARATGIAERRDFDVTVRVLKGDGTIAWARTISHPRFDVRGELTGILHLVQDVSESKRAEEAVRQSEERFRALIEHSNDMILIIGPDGGMRYRSPSAKYQFGYDEDEAFASKLLDRLHPDDHAEAARILPPLLASQGNNAAGRWRWAHKDGSWRVIDWTARNATEVPGIEGVIVNARDVTESAQLQEQLLQSRKMEAVGQLAGGIAHDFNNVLGAVTGFTGFLLQDLPANSEQRRFAERIAAAAERGKTLVQQIFVFSRHSSVEPEPTNIMPIVLETCDLLRASLPASAELEILSDGHDVVAMVNPAQLSQVLMNLCINGRDALAGKPGRVAIGIARVTPGEPDYAGFSGAPPPPAPGQDGSLVRSGALAMERAYARITVADTGQEIGRASCRERV
jgi:PAS domain S-box-containing protein